MAKEKEEERKERKMAGCACSTWVKLINMIIGGLMVAYSIFSFFEVRLSSNAIIVYVFKAYEM